MDKEKNNVNLNESNIKELIEFRHKIRDYKKKDVEELINLYSLKEENDQIDKMKIDYLYNELDERNYRERAIKKEKPFIIFSCVGFAVGLCFWIFPIII